MPTLPRFGRVVAEPHFGDYTPAMAIFPRRNRSRGVRSGMQETCRRVCQDACDRRSIADVCRSQSSSVLGLQLQVDRAPRWPGVSSSLKRPCLFSGSHACSCTVCSLVDRLVFGAQLRHSPGRIVCPWKFSFQACATCQCRFRIGCISAVVFSAPPLCMQFVCMNFHPLLSVAHMQLSGALLHQPVFAILTGSCFIPGLRNSVHCAACTG